MFYGVVRLSLFCVFEPFIELVISAKFTTQTKNTECFQVIRVISLEFVNKQLNYNLKLGIGKVITSSY